MKTLEWVKEHIDEVEQDHFLDHRFTQRFLDFLPVDEWSEYGFGYSGEGEPEVKEWTEENVLAQLKSDVEFAIDNCTFIGNNATGIGSYGYTSAGGAICIARGAHGTIEDSKFINNSRTFTT